MIELSAAFASARTALDMLKVGVEARDDAKIKAAVFDLQEKLFDTMSKAFAVQEQLAASHAAQQDAHRKIAELERQLEERGMYRLEELCAGHLAYGSQPSNDPAEAPKHYLCQPCYDKGVKSILRIDGEVGRSRSNFVCPAEERHSLFT